VEVFLPASTWGQFGLQEKKKRKEQNFRINIPARLFFLKKKDYR
jgi:hypothetical protein